MVGKTLSHFKITAKLGEGGMGEVYRAEDLNLKRDVALKMLPAEVAADPQRLERFQREAEAVAALNHPNIVTIYSVEREGDTPFIAMELVEGESLDRAMPAGGFSLPKALDVALAIAEALTVAHEKGVVHRDLKPSNVMLTRDGRFKVLDFGLAKLASDTEAAPGDLATEMPTEVAPLTGEGVVLGTAPYMSPEQAQGKIVDQRSDIFSLGSILYEAATGSRPFHGESSIDTLHRIIHAEPEPLAQRIPQAPLQLQWILRKALAKAPEDRYQSARDLAVDLRAVKGDLESESQLATVTSGQIAPQPSAGSSGRRTALIVAGAAVAIAAAAFWLLSRSSVPPREGSTAATQIAIRPITSSGLVTAAALSPDGQFVAYVESDQGRQSLHLRQINEPQSLVLVPREPVGFWGLSFVPDGTAIVYGIKSDREPLGSFYRISTLGGQPRKLVSAIDSPPSFSPDGTRMTWVRAQHPEPSQSAVMIADIDGSNARVLASVSVPEVLAPRFFTGTSWSPDGTLVAASVLRAEPPQRGSVVAFDATSGEVVWAGEHTWPWASMVHWLPDGSGLLVIAESEVAQDAQIWMLPYPRGAARRVTNDLLDYRIVSLASDGDTLLTIPTTRHSGIWSRPTDGSARAQRISRSTLDGIYGFAVTPDGRLVYQTLERGQLDLAIMDADGSNPRLLTNDPDEDRGPVMLTDDKVLWASRGPGGFSLVEMNLDGNGRRVVHSGSLTVFSRTTAADSVGIVFEHYADGFPTLWRLPPGSGEPERLTDYESFFPAISPDHKRLAFAYRNEDGQFRIGVTGIEGGRPLISLEQPISVGTGSYVRWTPDGRALLVNTVAGDRANLWRLPLDGGDAERLTDFDDQRFGWVDFSPDGETMYYSRGTISRDAVLIENFR